MRIPRGEAGRSTIENAFVVTMVALIAVIFLSMLVQGITIVVRVVGDALENSSIVQQPPNTEPPPDIPSSKPTPFSKIFNTVLFIALPALIFYLASHWDRPIGNETPSRRVAAKTRIRRDNRGQHKKIGATETNNASLSAILCLSAIPFEIWATANVLQGKVNFRTNLGVETTLLTAVLALLIVIDIFFYYLCSKQKHAKSMMIRFALVCISIIVPLCIFYGLSV